MSVYNGAEFLPDAIQSILGQTFSDFEFIVIDDGSTDGTQQVIGRYQDRRLIPAKWDHQGLVKSLNQGLRMARGRYVARQDADDISLPDRLLRQVEYLEARRDVALVGSGIGLIDDSKRLLRSVVYPAEHQALCAFLERVVSPLPHSTIMFRREAVQALGGYDERFVLAEDYELYLRLIERFQVASFPQVLVLLRYRVDSLSFAGDQADLLKFALLARALALIRRSLPEGLRADVLAWSDFQQRFERWFKASPLPCRFLAAKYRRSAEIKLHQHDYIGSLRILLRALWQDPQWVARRWIWRRTAYWDSTVERQVLELARACRDGTTTVRVE